MRDIQRLSLLRPNLRHGRVGEYPAVQELHDIEGGADDTGVLAQAVRLGHRNVGLLQRVDDLVLALHLVGRLRQELSRGLLPQHETLSVDGGEEVGGVRLAKAELDVS